MVGHVRVGVSPAYACIQTSNKQTPAIGLIDYEIQKDYDTTKNTQ